MEKAEFFQASGSQVVLASIKKTGSYSVQAASPAAKQSDTWLDKRLEGKDLMIIKNASLQQLIAGGSMLYAIFIIANDVNQAVLGFTETITNFKKQVQLPVPWHVSIPDILNMQRQVGSCYADTCFQKFVSDNLQRMQGFSEQDLIQEFLT